jgi:hypothetical protein
VEQRIESANRGEASVRHSGFPKLQSQR